MKAVEFGDCYTGIVKDFFYRCITNESIDLRDIQDVECKFRDNMLTLLLDAEINTYMADYSITEDVKLVSFRII